MTRYRAAEYNRVLELLQQTPGGQEPSLEVIKYALLSQLKLGKPEEAWKLYPKLVAANRPDDPALLRDIARGFVVSRVRDPQEHIRIAAYTALAEMSEGRDVAPSRRWAPGFIGACACTSGRSHRSGRTRGTIGRPQTITSR